MKTSIALIFILFSILMFSCNKQNDQSISTPKVEVWKIHDRYNSDSIEIEYPNGKIVKIKKVKTANDTVFTRGLRTETINDEIETNIHDEFLTPPLPPGTDPTDPEIFLSGAVWNFDLVAKEFSLNGNIIRFDNVYVGIRNPVGTYSDNGRQVTRIAKVFDKVGWDCIPLLPCPETVFTWHWIVNAYYTYEPYNIPTTRQFYYDRSRICYAAQN